MTVTSGSLESSENCHDLAERLAGGGVDLELGPLVERRRAAVDDRERSAGAQGFERKLGHRVDLERGADDEHQRRSTGQLVGTVDRRPRQQLAEEDDVRLEDGAAIQAARNRQQRFFERLSVPAGEAGCAADRAVYLDDLATPRSRVQQVDVLGDDRLDEAEALELREGLVRV